MGGEAGSDERDEREGRIEGRREKVSKGYNKVGFGQSSHSHSHSHSHSLGSAVQCSAVSSEKKRKGFDGFNLLSPISCDFGLFNYGPLDRRKRIWRNLRDDL